MCSNSHKAIIVVNEQWCRSNHTDVLNTPKSEPSDCDQHSVSQKQKSHYLREHTAVTKFHIKEHRWLNFNLYNAKIISVKVSFLSYDLKTIGFI